MAHKIHTSAIPLDAGWEHLTPAQQRIVRGYYPALDEADEPPYPAKGPRAFYVKLAGLVPYKPARCVGQPCQMTVPFNLKMSVRY